MEITIETIFRILVAIIVSVFIIYLANYYYQKAKVDIPSIENEKNIQIILVKNNDDVAKAIYGCYSLGNFGKLKQRIDCYIMKIQTKNLDDNIIRNILFENFTIGDVYEKISFGSLSENTTILVYYFNGYVRFIII